MPDPILVRRFFRLTLLNILSNVTVPLAGLVDTAMLGRLPHIRELAGVALAAVLFEFLYWSFGFLRMSTTGLTAQAVGKGDLALQHSVLYRAAGPALAIGLLILLLHPLIRETGFALLSGSPEVEEAGRSYFQGRIWGAPAALCNLALLGWFLGREEAQKALSMNALANLSNIALNYLFIMRLGWASLGAGLASMASQYVMLGLGIYFLLRSEPLTRIPIKELFNRAGLLPLIRLNRDILFRTFGLISAFALFTNISALMGVGMLAANAILLRYLTVAAFSIDGVAFASESLAGIYHGRGDRPSLHRLLRVSLGWSVGLAMLFVLAFLAAGPRPYQWLTVHQDVAGLAHGYSWGLFLTVLVGALAYCYDGIFLGLTQGRLLRNAMLASVFLVFLPLAAMAALTGNNSLLWASLVAFMAARAGFLAWGGRRALRLESDSSRA